MKQWSLGDLLAAAGRHILSEEHLRVQVLEVKPTADDELWRIPRGAVVVLVLSGSCRLLLDDERDVDLRASDQVVLFAGEAFAFLPASPSEPPAVLQFIWIPGISGR